MPQGKQDTDWELIACSLEGTCMTPLAAIYLFDLDCDEETLIDEVLNYSIEMCPKCGWWMESCMLFDEDSEEAMCDDCRKDYEEDE